jgi:hypothetical protein
MSAGDDSDIRAASGVIVAPGSPELSMRTTEEMERSFRGNQGDSPVLIGTEEGGVAQGWAVQRPGGALRDSVGEGTARSCGFCDAAVDGRAGATACTGGHVVFHRQCRKAMEGAILESREEVKPDGKANFRTKRAREILESMSPIWEGEDRTRVLVWVSRDRLECQLCQAGTSTAPRPTPCKPKAGVIPEVGSDFSGEDEAEGAGKDEGTRPSRDPVPDEEGEGSEFGPDDYALLGSMCKEFASLKGPAGPARLAVISGLLAGVPEDIEGAAKGLVGWSGGRVGGGSREAWEKMSLLLESRRQELFPSMDGGGEARGAVRSAPRAGPAPKKGKE